MGSAKTHPHIERPTEEQLRSVVEKRPPVIRDLYLATHRLILETLPDVAYTVDCEDGQIGYGARQYGYDGWGMTVLSPHTKWVSLIFMRGAHLNDSASLLEGTGNSVRHVKLRSLEQLKDLSSPIRKLIEAASQLNHHSAGPPEKIEARH